MVLEGAPKSWVAHRPGALNRSRGIGGNGLKPGGCKRGFCRGFTYRLRVFGKNNGNGQSRQVSCLALARIAGEFLACTNERNEKRHNEPKEP